MWNPTQSSSTAPSNDDNVNEVTGVDDCKCSGSINQSDKLQQQQNNYKEQTSTIGPPSAGPTNIQKYKGGSDEEEEKDNKALSHTAGETIDSGFISGPQSSYSAILDVDIDIKKLNITESASESQQHNKLQEQINIDSGIIEEDCDDLEDKKETYLDGAKMILPHSAESGISEWFCNLSLQNNRNTSTDSTVTDSGLNNLDAPKQQNSAQQPKIFESVSSYAVGSNSQQENREIPQQITPANAWEKYYQQNDDGDTPLHLACISGYEDVVAALIRMSPHPCLFNIQNDDAQTPLHLATLTAQPKIIRMLLIAGAKPTVRDRHGNTALHLACISGEEQCVRALTIPIGASEVNEAHRKYGHRANDKSYIKYAQLPSDLEIRNYDGERCVHLAAQAGFINILRILVLYGADINAREGKSGLTPLHIAIQNCNEELTNYLLDECQKLNLEAATYAGLTAYQVACALNKSEMQNILEKRGAEPLTPPDSDYDSSDNENDIDDSKLYDRFGDPGYFVGGYKGANAMTVA